MCVCIHAHGGRSQATMQPSFIPSLWQHASVHTPSALRARARLRHERRVVEQLDLWWATAVKSMQASGREDVSAMNEEEYVKISTKIYRTMILPYDENEAVANARREWEDDTKSSVELPCESFKDAIFELGMPRPTLLLRWVTSSCIHPVACCLLFLRPFFNSLTLNIRATPCSCWQPTYGLRVSTLSSTRSS